MHSTELLFAGSWRKIFLNKIKLGLFSFRYSSEIFNRQLFTLIPQLKYLQAITLFRFHFSHIFLCVFLVKMPFNRFTALDKVTYIFNYLTLITFIVDWRVTVKSYLEDQQPHSHSIINLIIYQMENAEAYSINFLRNYQLWDNFINFL